MGCPGQRLLPQDPAGEAAEVAAEHGTRLHAWKEGKEVYIPEEREEDLQWMRERYEGWSHEEYVVYDITTREGFLFPSEAEAGGCAKRPGKCLTGHIDAYWYDHEARRLYVNDLKTSQLPVALDDPQLLGYSVGVMAALYGTHPQGLRPIEVEISVLHWPRHGYVREEYQKKSGKPYKWYSSVYPAQAIKDFASEIAKSLTDMSRLSIGLHCVYCPSLNHCPMYKAKKEHT